MGTGSTDGYAVYNPKGLPEEELPVIYGFNNGGPRNWLMGVLLAQDGTYLGGHVCSNESYMPGDLGVLAGSRPDRHDTFRGYYPDGYRMAFVSYNEVGGHAGLQAAIAENKKLREGQPPCDSNGDPDYSQE